MSREKIITVFGSSRPRVDEPDYEEARILGRVLAESGFAVCSGGYAGVMEAVSRGAKDGGGKTYGVTAEFFGRQANSWVDQEVRLTTWQDRLFELIRLAHGFVVCKGGTGTLVELAVVWEMLNKSVMIGKPVAILGHFWEPIIERVRQVELAHEAPWGERNGPLVYAASTPEEAARHLREKLR